MLARIENTRFGRSDQHSGQSGDFVEAQPFSEIENSGEAMIVTQAGKRLVDLNLQLAARWLAWFSRRFERC